jgi:hypothetical protein
MIDYIREQISGISNSNKARLIVREYLQARILESLQDAGVFTNWAFLGGTALRFLYQLPRYSEDLVFSLTDAIKDSYHTEFAQKFEKIVENIEKKFFREHYSVTTKSKTDTPVMSAFIRFSQLLFDLHLSSHPSEVISVKIELDTNPPEGARCTNRVIRKHVILNLQHYDKSSLFSEKLQLRMCNRFSKSLRKFLSLAKIYSYPSCSKNNNWGYIPSATIRVARLQHPPNSYVPCPPNDPHASPAISVV